MRPKSKVYEFNQRAEIEEYLINRGWVKRIKVTWSFNSKSPMPRLSTHDAYTIQKRIDQLASTSGNEYDGDTA